MVPTQMRERHLCRVAETLEAELGKTDSVASVVDVVHRATVDLGCTGFAFLNIDRAEGGVTAQVVSSYPEPWREHYLRNNLFERDPVLTECANTITPMRWQQVEQEVRRRDGDADVFDQAYRFGLRSGLAVPVHRPAGQIAIFNVATDVSGLDAESRFDRFQHTFHAMAFVIYEFINRLMPKILFDLPLVRLNSECVEGTFELTGDLN